MHFVKRSAHMPGMFKAIWSQTVMNPIHEEKRISNKKKKRNTDEEK